MSYFHRHHHRRFSPVIPSLSEMNSFAYEQPVQEQQNVVYDQPRPSYKYRTQRYPLASRYSDVNQSMENLDPQRPVYLCEPQWNLQTFQQSTIVNPNSHIQSPVPTHSHRYYCEDASPTSLVQPAIPTTVRIIRADGSVVYEIVEPHRNRDAEGCRAMEDPINERLQDEKDIERPPTRETPTEFFRRPHQSSDEEQSHDTAGAAGSIEGGSFGWSRDEILDELELLVSAMRQLLLDYRVLSKARGKEPSEQEDVLGKNDGTGKDEDLEDSTEERA
ncbi:hypothetical protein BDU57DRAFT_532026 [Ampelomyces quisqualis]|uniref:Uncharacterized protein n=1 Tax=Ampelomyces quisqualis TaxID=50730 RepID=A0A6A5QFG6_AMPQU|nr:hypothetical protein BDU57DRAFT_532026 [Ampelomyces quisqualis]